MKLNLNLPSPIQEVDLEKFGFSDIHLFLKRDDLIHQEITGNKYRKMKYNLIEFQETQLDTILSFGGAYSNHIRALAALGKELNIKTIGVIRGNEFKFLNPMLEFAQDCGMHLHFVSREEYGRKKDERYIQTLKEKFGQFYNLPEGGSNTFALKGCKEIVMEIDIEFDVITCPCGTAGTLAGIITGINENQKAIGFSALKGGEFLKEDVKKFHHKSGLKNFKNWEIMTDYHFGGYAKRKPELDLFIEEFYDKTEVKLDYVYNGKAMFGLIDLIKKNYFKPSTIIVSVITGGLDNASIFD